MNALLAATSPGLAEFLIGGAILFGLCLLLSFWPAALGHWSAPWLATPGLLVGLLLLVFSFGPHFDGIVRVLAALPPIVGVSSLTLWARRRKPNARKPASGAPPA